VSTFSVRRAPSEPTPEPEQATRTEELQPRSQPQADAGDGLPLLPPPADRDGRAGRARYPGTDHILRYEIQTRPDHTRSITVSIPLIPLMTDLAWSVPGQQGSGEPAVWEVADLARITARLGRCRPQRGNGALSS